MQMNGKATRGLISIVAILFGLLLGVGLTGCGKEDTHPDFKSILKDMSHYIDDIERKNVELTVKLQEMTKKFNKKTVEKSKTHRRNKCLY